MQMQRERGRIGKVITAYEGEDACRVRSIPRPVANGRGRRVTEHPSDAKAKTITAGAGSNRIRWIFAAKTTASAIISLLIAFTFDLDQPQWTLLTVFIVAQPQSGLVLAKSLHRIIGTLIGAAMALLLVGLFAQERVLFLGALALWVGFCTFGSQYARSFAAYGFVLSGYTAAIVGIPGALEAGNAFFVAVARVTEVCLGIIVTATISHLVLPMSLAASLRHSIAAARDGLADHAVAVLRGGDGASLPTKLLGAARTIRDLAASAVFEDRDMREGRDALRRLGVAFVKGVTLGQPLRWRIDAFRPTAGSGRGDMGETIDEVAIAIQDWRRAAINASQLGGRLVRACAAIAAAERLCRDASVPDAELVQHIAAVARLRDFLASFITFARAYEAFASGKKGTSRAVGIAVTTDRVSAAWAGMRAALALGLVGIFWIVADWPRGSTAVILSTVVTARLATMESGGKAAIAGTIVLVLATFPAFILVDVLLPHAQGFEMFTLVVAPVLFLCAYLMGSTKPPLAYLSGFLFALYFASVGAFQDRMTYDAVGFVNTSIAVVFAIAVGAVLFSIVAPDSPRAARRRFRRAVQRLWASIADPRRSMVPAEFERAVADALVQFQPEETGDMATLETGADLLSIERGLTRLRREAHASTAQLVLERDITALIRHPDGDHLAHTREQIQVAVAEALADLRESTFATAVARAAARRIAGFSAIDDGFSRGGALIAQEA